RTFRSETPGRCVTGAARAKASLVNIYDPRTRAFLAPARVVDFGVRFTSFVLLATAAAALGAQGPGHQPLPAPLADTTVLRGLYVNRWAAQSKPKIRALIKFA